MDEMDVIDKMDDFLLPVFYSRFEKERFKL